MANVRVTKKPTAKVTSLGAPTREGGGSHKMTAKWKVPSGATNGKSNKRFGGLDVTWTIGTSGGNRVYSGHTGNEGMTSNSKDLNWFPCGSGNLTRASFYPLSGDRLNFVKVSVRGTNSKGKGPWAEATRQFGPPAAPTVSALSQNADTGVVSCTVKTDPGNEYAERHDTRVQVIVTDSRRGTWVAQDWTTTATEVTVSQDVPDRMTLAYGQYVQVTVKACARGYAGDSWWPQQQITVSYPALATIHGVDARSKDVRDKVTVRISTNSQWWQPVTGVRLQKLVSSTYRSAEAIPANAGWENTNIVDNDQCSALSVGVADLIPDPGRYTWVRLKTWNQHEALFYRYTAPARVQSLETPLPTAADDAVELASLTPGADGRSAVAVMAWDRDGTDDSNLTQLTWSEDENAWRSTEGPEDYEFEWDDGPATVGGVRYNKSATVHIAGLKEGTKYFARARRHMTGDNESYGPWSKTLDVLPTTAPSSVSLVAPAFVPRGSAIELSWTFDGGSTQTGWKVSSGDVVVASGSDALGSCVLDADRVGELAGSSESVELAVSVSTGGAWVSSEACEVRLADPPVVSVDLAPTLTAQPVSFAVSCSTAATLSVVITSQGVQGDLPGGTRTQPAGDCVWSEQLAPEWDEDGGALATTVTAPAGLDLWDRARYTVSVSATDEETGLRSAEVLAETEVAWAHQAPAPGDSIAVTPSDATDEDGNRAITCDVALAASDGMAAGDVYDVYRVTSDGPYQIAADVPPGTTVTDPYAPYGGGALAYRVACRTPDGDVDWDDYPYELDADELRIDFGTSYVELPYNLAVSDAWSKDFESRRHLDGTEEGYWNEGATRRGSLSTDLIRVEGAAAAVALRELARHAGQCFVRTPDGCAYAADVEVGGMAASYGSSALAVSLDATEVAPGPQWWATAPDDGEIEDEGEVGG